MEIFGYMNMSDEERKELLKQEEAIIAKFNMPTKGTYTGKIKKCLDGIQRLNTENAQRTASLFDLAEAISTPEMSAFLRKAIKVRIKEIHPDIAGENPHAVAFINAWNVIKLFLNRDTSMEYVMDNNRNTTCKYCGNEKSDKRSGSKYCSNKCKQADYRKRKHEKHVADNNRNAEE